MQKIKILASAAIVITIIIGFTPTGLEGSWRRLDKSLNVQA